MVFLFGVGVTRDVMNVKPETLIWALHVAKIVPV